MPEHQVKERIPELWLDGVVGISIDEIQDGLNAATEVFTKHRMTLTAAMAAPEVWEKAQQAALETAYRGWRTIPSEVKLILVTPSQRGEDD